MSSFTEVMNGEANLLQPNTYLKTNFGELRVIEHLGGGSQGDVYSVWYNGEKKALKWYYSGEGFLDKDDFIWNLRCNVNDYSNAPKGFLWPIDMTEPDAQGRFGYVMDLVDTNVFYNGDDIFINPGVFSSFRQIIDVCLNIARGFMLLHDQGYVYRDISGGNFYVDPLTGQVLVCDTDNVAPSSRDTGVRGTGTFRAPEVIVSNVDPTVQSDLHSLAVVIFRLLLMHHPFEGRRFDNCMLDEDTCIRLYGSDALFIFDERDNSNAPLPGCNADRIWPKLPEHMRRMFQRAFSQQALHEPKYRPTEIEWVRELARLRSEVVGCPVCGRETFLEDAHPQKCANPACETTVTTPLQIKIPLGLLRDGKYVPYVVPIAHDTRIYGCQIGEIDPRHALDCIAWMYEVEASHGTIGIQNVSRSPWKYKIGEEIVSVAPGQAVYAYDDRSLILGGEFNTLEICRTNKREG